MTTNKELRSESDGTMSKYPVFSLFYTISSSEEVARDLLSPSTREETFRRFGVTRPEDQALFLPTMDPTRPTMEQIKALTNKIAEEVNGNIPPWYW